jgi:hypothetical protein
MTRKQFTKSLKAWRERKGFTQAQAADWEIERNMPRGFGLNALLKAIAPR